LLALGACSEEYTAEPYEAAEAENEPVPLYEPGQLYHPLTHKQCVACDSHSPCFNGETCVPLQPLSVDANEYDATHRTNELSCPCNAIDTRDYHIHSTTILWVAFGLLFAPALYFMWRGFDEVAEKIDPEWNTIRIGAGVVNVVASLAYLTMALGYGFTTKCSGRDFYYARYVDWLITTPIMLHKYIRLSEDGDQLTQMFLVIMDIFMIAAGLIGELIEGSERWAYFGFAVLVFLPIVWILATLVKHNHASCFFGHFSSEPIDRNDPHFSLTRLFANLASLVIASWVVYPIIWILANVSVRHSTDACKYGSSVGVGSIRQLGIISVQGEAYAYTILDIISKTVAGWYIVSYDPKIKVHSTRSVQQVSHGGISATKGISAQQRKSLQKTTTAHSDL